MRIRVLLVDDHRMFREGVRQILALTDDVEVVGEAKDGEEAERKAASLRPDVILMDLSMPGTDGITAIRRIAATQPETRFVALTMHGDDKHLFEALKAGAHGFVLKDASAGELCRAIREVHSGRSPLDSAVSAQLLREFRRLAVQQNAPGAGLGLSAKEVEVLRLVAAGLSNKEIGAKLYLAEKTVKNYLTNIFQKIGAADRVQAAIFAHRHGIVPSAEESPNAD